MSALHVDGPTISNKTQRQALEGLVAGNEVISDGIDDEPQELIFLQSTAQLQSLHWCKAALKGVKDAVLPTSLRSMAQAI